MMRALISLVRVHGLCNKHLDYVTMLVLGKFLSVEMPTATQIRRQVSTNIAASHKHGEVEVVAKHLGHNPDTSFRCT